MEKRGASTFTIVGLLIVVGLLTSGFFLLDGLGNLSLGSWFVPLLIVGCAIFCIVALASMMNY